MASTPALLELEGRPLVVDENVEVLEGTWHGTRTVVVEFGSVEQARRWYESDSSQKAAPVRQAAADCDVVLLSGFVPPRGEPR